MSGVSFEAPRFYVEKYYLIVVGTFFFPARPSFNVLSYFAIAQSVIEPTANSLCFKRQRVKLADDVKQRL